MRLLDLEFESAIKDLPNQAIEELRDALAKARWNRVKFKCLNTDELKRVVNEIRQKYRLDPTTEMDDDKAIEAIENPIERRMKSQEREKSPGKKVAVRLLSEQGMESVLDQEIKMRRVAKYADTLKSLPREKISELWNQLFDEYNPAQEDYRVSNSVEANKRREIDPKYGINYYDKMHALERAEAVLVLRECFAKCSLIEFRDKRDKIENLNRQGDVYTSYLYGEVGVVAEILGIDFSYQSKLTMSDIAQAIEVREKELQKEQGQGINMSSIVRGGLVRGVTGQSVLGAKTAERHLGNQSRNNDGVIK